MYKLKFRTVPNNMLVTRSFDSVKVMTQFVRRNAAGMSAYRYYYGSEPIFFVGSKMVTLATAVMKVQELQTPL